MPPSSRTSVPGVAILAALAGLVGACSTRDDDGVGAAFITAQAELEAVELLEFSAPDTTADYQLDEVVKGLGATSTLAVGRHAGLEAVALLRFDSDVFPDSGTGIDSAFIDLVFTDGHGADATLDIEVSRITESWSENDTLTAGTLPATAAPETTLSLALADIGDTTHFRIPTSLYVDWMNDRASNHGVLLRAIDGAAAMVEFRSNQTSQPPRLIGWWTDTGVDTSKTVVTDDDSVLMTKSGFASTAGVPGRVTLARGVPGRAFLKFAIPGRDELPELWDMGTINRAELVLTFDHDQSSFGTVRLGARRILEEPWTGETTRVGDVLYGLADALEGADTVTINLADYLQELITEEAIDHGLEVRALDERLDADYIRFHAHDSEEVGKRPRLSIWYTPGPRGATP